MIDPSRPCDKDTANMHAKNPFDQDQSIIHATDHASHARAGPLRCDGHRLQLLWDDIKASKFKYVIQEATLPWVLCDLKRMAVDNDHSSNLQCGLRILQYVCTEAPGVLSPEDWTDVVCVLLEILRAHGGGNSGRPSVTCGPSSATHVLVLKILKCTCVERGPDVPSDLNKLLEILIPFLAYELLPPSQAAAGAVPDSSNLLIGGCDDRKEDMSPPAKYQVPHRRRAGREGTCSDSASDGDVSDDGSVCTGRALKAGRVRLAALQVVQALARKDSQCLRPHWTKLLTLHTASLCARPQPPNLVTAALTDPVPRVRALAAHTLVDMLDGSQQRSYLAIAEANELLGFGKRGFLALSTSLGHTLVGLHKAIHHGMTNEEDVTVILALLRLLRVLICSTPYARLPQGLLCDVMHCLLIRRARLHKFSAAAPDSAAEHSALLACIADVVSTKKAFPDLLTYLESLNERNVGIHLSQPNLHSNVLISELLLCSTAPNATLRIEAVRALRGIAANYAPILDGLWNFLYDILEINVKYSELSLTMQLPVTDVIGKGVNKGEAQHRESTSLTCDLVGKSQQLAVQLVFKFLSSWAFGAVTCASNVQTKAQTTACGTRAAAQCKAFSIDPNMSDGEKSGQISSNAANCPSRIVNRSWIDYNGHGVSAAGTIQEVLLDKWKGNFDSINGPNGQSSHSELSKVTEIFIRQGNIEAAWMEAFEAVLPLAVHHANPMVRAAVYNSINTSCLPPSMLRSFACTRGIMEAAASTVQNDTVSAVRAAACRVLGSMVLKIDNLDASENLDCETNTFGQSASFHIDNTLDVVAESLAQAVKDSTLSVRFAAASATADVSEALYGHLFGKGNTAVGLPTVTNHTSTSCEEDMLSVQCPFTVAKDNERLNGLSNVSSSKQNKSVESLAIAGLRAAHDQDKVRVNGIRALAYLIPLYVCCCDEKLLPGENWCKRALHCLQASTMSPNSKILWNACFAIKIVFRSQAVLSSPAIRVLSPTLVLAITNLLKKDTNVKTCVHAAAALASLQDKSFSRDIYLEAINAIESNLATTQFADLQLERNEESTLFVQHLDSTSHENWGVEEGDDSADHK